MKSKPQYIVTLTEEKRQELRVLVEKGQTQGYRIKHAQILIKLDEIPENQEWTYDKITVDFAHYGVNWWRSTTVAAKKSCWSWII